jgi:DNA-binding beta-propeller fold protein YncE
MTKRSIVPIWISLVLASIAPASARAAAPLADLPAAKPARSVTAAANHCLIEGGRNADAGACLAHGLRQALSPVPSGSVPHAQEPLPIPGCNLPRLDDRCEAWTTTFDHATGHGSDPQTSYPRGWDVPVAQALSPAGDRVYVVGATWDNASLGYDLLTVAVDTGTGALLWSRRYDGGLDVESLLDAVVSPDGSLVFVTGASSGGNSSDTDIVTMALRTVDGTTDWMSTLDGGGPSSLDVPAAITVAPDGTRIFVAGTTQEENLPGPEQLKDFDVATVAYEASTGLQLWRQSFDGTPHPAAWHFPDADFGYDLEISPDGSRVHVLGSSIEPNTWYDFQTLTYSADDGDREWVRAYDQGEGFGDLPYDLAVSPTNGNVYVVGGSKNPVGNRCDIDVAVAGYSDQGVPLWSRTFHPPRSPAGPLVDGWNEGYRVEVDPSGSRIYLAAILSGEYEANSGAFCEPDGGGDSDYGTLAYDAGTGELSWWKRFTLSNWDEPTDLAVAPGGAHVYVTGTSLRMRGWGIFPIWDSTTVAYDTATGDQSWVGRYNVSGYGVDLEFGGSVDVTPTGKVIATSHGGSPESADNASDIHISSYQSEPAASGAMRPQIREAR